MKIDRDSFHQIVQFEDQDLLVLNKPPGMAVQSKDQEDLCTMAEFYIGAQAHAIHRIDQPASGLVLLAKNAESAAKFGTLLRDKKLDRTYLAIVATPPAEPQGSLTHYLQKSRSSNRMIASMDGKGQKAELNYRQLHSSEHYHLLEVKLSTGRQHQIRAQMSAIGSPIKGDNKYGFKRGNRDRSIHLHSWKIQYTDQTGQVHAFVAPPPQEVLWDFFAESL